MTSQLLRNLPSVERVVSSDILAAAVATYGREWLVDLTRDALAEARRDILAGGEPRCLADIAEAVRRTVDELVTPSPRPLINATGVVIHTNLGRAPLSKSAIAAADAVAGGYSDLEIDLDTGRRGSRQAHLQSLLRQITGAEAALVVNNNASALLLGLSALAAGREVIVARGEAVEIGGGFPHPRRAAPKRLYSRGRWHDQPHLRARLRGRRHRRHRRVPESPRQQLPRGGVHRRRCRA